MGRQIRRVVSTVALLLSLASLPGPALAQSGLGSISATVADESGGVLPGAQITLVEVATDATRTTVTNDVGLFTIPAVPAGVYTVTITLENFKTYKVEHFTVNSFQQLSLGKVTLELSAGATDVIEVTADRPLLDLDSGVRMETIQAHQVQDMPIQGRNWATLLKIVPGANPSTTGINGREYNASGYNEYTINGKNSGQTQVNLDGGSLVDHGSDGKLTVAPSLESIQEVSVLANNFQAEYGNRGGTVVNIVTKSGTNQFKGAIFDYLRNEALNANSWDNNFNGIEKQRYRFNYFGGNLGGPIQRGKLFFFYNYEKFKQERPGDVLRGRVPTELERNGDFSQTVNADGTRPTIYMPGTQFSGNPDIIASRIIPSHLINPLGRALMNSFPLPNNPSDPNNNFIMPYERKDPRQSQALKIDWNLSTKTHAYARYTEDGGTQQDRNLGSSGGILPGGLIQRPRPDRAFAGNVTHTFSPTFVMNSLVAWSYDSVQWQSVDPAGISRSAFGLANLPSTYPVVDDVLPAVNTGTYGSWQFNRIPAYALANEYQFASTFTWARSSHVFKWGVQYIRNLKDEIDATENKGTYDFTNGVGAGSPFDMGYSPANILTGAVSRFTQFERVARKNSIYNDIHAFVQDTWKASSNLTLDYGVRFYHIPTEHNRYPDDTLDAVFVPSQWDPAKAPRFYLPDPRNPNLIIDPAFPNTPLPSNLANLLRYTIVPNSGDLMNGIVPLGKNGEGKAGIRDPKTILFAPRGGFAWTPFGSQKTLIRGGFGWAYNRNNIANTVNQFENALSGFANRAHTSFDAMAGSGGVEPITPRSFGARDETQQNVPTVYDYSLSVQRELFSNLVIDIAYVGNTQTNQPITFNLNAIAPGTMWRPEFVDPRSVGSNFAGPISASNPGPALPGTNAMDPIVMRPYRGFNSLNMTSNIGKVTYNALQVSASKRLSGGFSFEAYYTLSKAVTETENAGLYNFNWQNYSGYPVGNDRRHVFNLNYTYEVPKVAEKIRFNNPVGRAILDDWKIAHLFTAVSGSGFSPGFTIQESARTNNVSLNQVFMGTPDLGPRLQIDGNPNGGGRDAAHNFDPTQFAIPGFFPGYDGTGERNFLRGRGMFGSDISFIKIFRVLDTRRLEVRANVFNLFNSVRRTAINGTVGYKANGRTFADGFRLFNTPEMLEERARQNGVTDPLALFNQYRTGVGHVNVTDVQPPRIIELGLAFRF